MFATRTLRQYVCRLTLFTRDNCGLCNEARSVLGQVWNKRPFEYDVVDIMKPEQREWKSIYEFDVPVLHIDKTSANNHKFKTQAATRKMMHHFTEKQITDAMDERMMQPSTGLDEES